MYNCLLFFLLPCASFRIFPFQQARPSLFLRVYNPLHILQTIRQWFYAFYLLGLWAYCRRIWFIYLFVIKPILSSLGHTAFSFLCLICCSGSLIIFSLLMLVLELFFHQFLHLAVCHGYFEIHPLQLQRFALLLPFD